MIEKAEREKMGAEREEGEDALQDHLRWTLRAGPEDAALAPLCDVARPTGSESRALRRAAAKAAGEARETSAP